MASEPGWEKDIKERRGGRGERETGRKERQGAPDVLI